MVDILQSLVDESEALPQEAVETVLAQFLKKRKEESPAAHKLAVELSNATADKLQRYVCQVRI
jgi:sister chromatid cohesion protein PDS5